MKLQETWNKCKALQERFNQISAKTLRAIAIIIDIDIMKSSYKNLLEPEVTSQKLFTLFTVISDEDKQQNLTIKKLLLENS